MKTNIYIPERQLQEMERACNKIVTNLNREKTKVLLTAARKVRKRIKEKAPRGPTGNLKKAAYAKAHCPGRHPDTFHAGTSGCREAVSCRL